MTDDKRLIEDYLPIQALNAIAAKEKKHPKHHVALIHYWPARRPISASRAAVYAALVGAPTTDKERRAAAKFVGLLASYDVAPSILASAIENIRTYNGGKAPKVLDLFSGGGAIPLEAARLGCESHALDYSPVAHLIELCTLVYPQRYGATLADDVERWGRKVLDRVRNATEDLYPNVRIPGSAQVSEQIELFGESSAGVSTGQTCQPVAYIWARTVPCRKPGCNAVVPLVKRSWLRKKGVFVAAVPRPKNKARRLEWEIMSGGSSQDVGSDNDDQTGAGESACPECTTPVVTEYVKECSRTGRLNDVLASVVVDGGRSKLYLPPSVATTLTDNETLAKRLEQIEAEAGFVAPDEEMKGKLRDQLPSYGFTKFRDLFTPRQLVVLMEMAKHIRIAHREMMAGGMEAERAKAVSTFLTMAFGRFANSFTKFCRWQARDQITIAAIGDRQALKMVYDYSEINPFAETAGSLPMALNNEVFCIKKLACIGDVTTVTRGSAENLLYDDATFDAVVTDPPYYSSIFYADLSSFFYVWHRRILGDLYPEHFASKSPPKKREAVAQSSEHDGDEQRAEEHYRDLMLKAFTQARRVLKPGAPLVCVYAHKTTEGWASLIKALVPAGLMVTEAWPIQTEAKGRTNAIDAAALSDSIFLVARRRENSTTGQYEAEVQPELEVIARERVETLWDMGVSGADLVIASVGAGMRAFTRFARVEYANGEEVPAERFLFEVETVVLESILARLSKEVGGKGSRTSLAGLDPATRFYILWRYTYGGAELEAGEAIIFATGTHVELDGQQGLTGGARALVEKKKGKYRLRDYTERGDDDDLGLPADDGQPATPVDMLHRLLWLLEKRPPLIPEFLNDAQPNKEQLRLVAQALGGPALKGGEMADVSPSAEQSTLGKLLANWNTVMEGKPATGDRQKGQGRLL